VKGPTPGGGWHVTEDYEIGDDSEGASRSAQEATAMNEHQLDSVFRETARQTQSFVRL